MRKERERFGITSYPWVHRAYPLLFPSARKVVLSICIIAFTALMQFCNWGSLTGRAGSLKKVVVVGGNKIKTQTYTITGIQMLQMLVFSQERQDSSLLRIPAAYICTGWALSWVKAKRFLKKGKKWKIIMPIIVSPSGFGIPLSNSSVQSPQILLFIFWLGV